MTIRSPSVIVVGAGPAGATLAYLLGSRGIDVTLLERQHDFEREFRGEVLVPGGVEALTQMGLSKIFEEVPQSPPVGIELYANGKPVFQLDIDPSFVGPNRPTAFSQPAFLEAVIGAASSYSSFRVRLATSVRGLLRDGDRVGGVRASNAEGELELHADLVVGADGRASAVRRRGGFKAHDQGIPVDVVWFKVPLPDFLGGGAPVRVYIGRAHLLIAYQAPDGLLQVAWVITKGTYGELRQRGVQEWVEEIANHVTPDLGEHLRQHRERLTHPFLLSAASDRVERWCQPGVLLIGDAAHTMSPVGGQGINIALRDTVVAANHLIPVLLRDPTLPRIDAAIEAIEAEREPELAVIQRLQAVPPKVLMGRTWWGASLRAIVPRLLRFGFVRNRAAPLARRILFGIGEVRLEV